MAPQNAVLWHDHLMSARWFQGKGLPIRGIDWHPLPWYTNDDDVMVRSELVDVSLGGTSQTYHLLVGYMPAGTAEPGAFIGQIDLPGRGLVDIVDAPHSPTAMAALLRAITQSGAPGVVWFDNPPEPSSDTTVFPGEQSNTTIKIGENVLFKMYRKLCPGPNLESKMLAALTRSGITPRLIGTLSTSDGGYELGMFSQRIKNTQNGWDWCVEACQTGRSIDAEMSILGSTLRRLHTELAAVFGVSTINAGIIAQQMLARLDAACEAAPEITQWRPPLRAIMNLPSSQVAVQRVHGDFHLGQALISTEPAKDPARMWTIIDFEGEPLKTPAERSAPDTVWRDIAGLLRSLDYARHENAEPDSESARKWHLNARQNFLDGYCGNSPLPLETLTAYETDKAIYELVYETRNRPSWTDIPRQAILQTISQSSSV